MNTPSIKESARDAGLVIAGEPLAVDLADTIKMSFDPPRDLIQDAQRNEFFWRIEQPPLPRGRRRGRP